MDGLALYRLVGTHVYLQTAEKLAILCHVTNAKLAYGNQRLEVEPVEGEGRAWVDMSRVRTVAAAAGTTQEFCSRCGGSK